jgi:hypothetical protein
MPAYDQLFRFSQMEQDGPELRFRFGALTSAHHFFQSNGLKSISVSDAHDDGSIEAVFMNVRIRFQLLMIFSETHEPRGRVICTHCRGIHGPPVQEDKLGGFTFDTHGVTDLASHVDGEAMVLERSAPQIVLTFLERAMAANRGW